MKKLAYTLIACLAFLPSIYAIENSLSRSLLEYETVISAIKNDPNFENIIDPNESIVEIKSPSLFVRKKFIPPTLDPHDPHEHRFYEVVTLSPTDKLDKPIDELVAQNIEKELKHLQGWHKKHPNMRLGYPHNNYIVKLDVKSNPEDGSDIVTVSDITKIDFSKSKPKKCKKQPDERE